MNKKKKYISVIIEMALVFSIMLSILAIFVKSVALNKNTYLNILNENNTYSYVKESIYEKMDKVLGSNINNDIKESIIAEEDIKREADTLITGLIEYLQTGENNIAPIDTQIYVERVEKAINLILTDIAQSSSKELSFNDIQFENMALTKNQFQFNNMMVFNEVSKSGQDSFHVEKVMSQSEAEDKIRSLLKQKGLTESEARQKMAEKGITKEQALDILEGYGITIDEAESGGNNSSSNDDDNQTSSGNSNSQSQGSNDNSNNNQSQDSIKNGNVESQVSNGSLVQDMDSENSNNDDTTTEESKNSNSKNGPSFMSKLKDEIIEAVIIDDGKTIAEKLIAVEDKVSDEVNNKMNTEIEKMNLNKLIASNKLESLAKITSTFYKMFWLFMILPVVLMLILIKLNNGKLNSSLRYIGSGFVLAGVFILLISFGGYISRLYENININMSDINVTYLKDVISITVKQLLKSLSISGGITFSIGLALLIPQIKNSLKVK